MASATLIRNVLPSEPELRCFASAAAHLLIERLPRASGSRAGTRRAGVGLQYFDHRDYAPGDEVRHIDWLQTARRRRPILRRFESESVSDWTLVLDASSSMAVQDAAKWRSAVLMAAALSYALLQLGHRVGLLAFGERVLAEVAGGRGQHHYAAIARVLAVLQPAGLGARSELGVCERHLHGGTSVFVIGDCLADDEMRRDLGALAQHCNALHIVQLRDAAETTLQLEGDFDLEDVETGLLMPACAGQTANRLAAGERAAMTQRLRSFCSRSGVAFTDWDIAQPWQLTLLRHFVQARSRC